MNPTSDVSRLQKIVWDGSIPLEIRLSSSDCRTFDQSDPYLIQCPRLSYLPFLLPRIHAFYSSFLINPDVPHHEGWFSHENVPLKWHYPVGLLYDLFSGAEPNHAGRSGKSAAGTAHGEQVRLGPEATDSEPEAGRLPWRVTVHFSDWPEDQLIGLDPEGKIIQDAFVNSVKEADFLRNGTAKVVMSLSKDDSTQLWDSVKNHDLTGFNSINKKLVNPPGTGLRHIPVKVYLPTAPAEDGEASQIGSLRVVQSLITPSLPSRQPQTIGTALNSLLPEIFPSRRNPVLAQVVLHGAVVPLTANAEDLLKAAAYADGFLHLAVKVLA